MIVAFWVGVFPYYRCVLTSFVDIKILHNGCFYSPHVSVCCHHQQYNMGSEIYVIVTADDANIKLQK